MVMGGEGERAFHRVEDGLDPLAHSAEFAEVSLLVFAVRADEVSIVAEHRSGGFSFDYLRVRQPPDGSCRGWRRTCSAASLMESLVVGKGKVKGNAAGILQARDYELRDLRQTMNEPVPSSRLVN